MFEGPATVKYKEERPSAHVRAPARGLLYSGCSKMVSAYTVGLCLRSWCLTVLVVSVTASLLYLTFHILALGKHSSADDLHLMKEHMSSIDFRLKANPRVDTGDDAFVFDGSHRPQIKHPHQTIKDTPGDNKPAKSKGEPLHEDASKVVKQKQKAVPSKQKGDDNVGIQLCKELSKLIVNEVEVYLDDQWHLTYHGKHRHRPEAMKHGFYLNKTEVRHALRRKRSCQDYLHEVYSERLILSDVFRKLRAGYDVADYDPSDVTMMTQLSGNRLDKLLLSLQHWTGPVSVAIFARSTAIRPITQILCRSALDRLQYDLKVHIVLRVKEKYYPVNLLRNVALRAIHTDYVFLSDADFVPSLTAHDVIKWHLAHLSLKHRGRVALVVPAFEAVSADTPGHQGMPRVNNTAYIYPQNKTKLLQQEWEGTVEPFHMEFFPSAHMPSNFTRWRSATRPYRIHYGPYFEPYVVVATTAIPPYVEEFLGRQMNKVTHIRALHSQHFQFWVLPDVYTIHLPHEVERGPQDYWRCVNTVANMVMLRIQQAEEEEFGNKTMDVIEHIYGKQKSQDKVISDDSKVAMSDGKSKQGLSKMDKVSHSKERSKSKRVSKKDKVQNDDRSIAKGKTESKQRKH